MTAVRGVRSWLATGDWGQYRKHPWWAALLFGPAVAAVAALIAGAAWRTLIVPGPDGATVIPVQHASSSRPLPPHRAAPARPAVTPQPPRPVVPRDTSSAPAPTWPASSNRPSPSSPVPALSSPPSLPPSSPPPSTEPPTTEPPSPGESPPPTWPPWFTPPPGTTPGSDRIRRNQDTPLGLK